jgi:Lrp/AsnC family leucine-responsive transcriptional regulator
MTKSHLDRIDRRMLEELQRDGRLPATELAERVGLSPTPCLRRLRQLEDDGVISGYTAVVDPQKLDLNIVAYIELKLDQRSEADTAAFREAVLAEPAIIECYALTGTIDYLLKVAVRDLEEFSELTMQKILRYPGVRSITSGLMLQVLKQQRGYPVLPPESARTG